MGMEKCILRAKQAVYWPRITSDIKQIVSQCSICQTHQKIQRKETLLPHDIAQYPWQKLGSDIFEYKGQKYVLIVDYYSKFPIVRKLGSTPDAYTVIAYFKSIFCEYGIPEELISDNGPKYACKKFKDFCALYKIKHSTSSPNFPQSNGMSERYVQTIKNLIIKALESGEDANIALLNYRSTPVCSSLPSPAKLLMNRNIRTLLPISKSMLKSQNVDNDHVKDILQNRQDKQKDYFDHNVMPELPSSNEGQSVRLYDKDSKKWKPATAVRNTNEEFTLSQDEMDNVYDTVNDDESSNDDSRCVTTPVTVSPQQVERRSSTRSIKKPERLIEHI